MIINTTPDNLVKFGGVTSISEFKIKNSAKAFGILSSGLYANKIRAIIRELSCNAYDSHVAAGCKEMQFDVHLPTPIQPYFSIRDYGTGLSHDDVINIYTTYFESTKTKSNDFIGALGLGSKSPFSYTDNFTITAIKDGTKGIYSAFISNEGVPAVALMGTETTDEHDGVEIRFAVQDQYDYRKFVYEAEYVFRYFATAPKFTGATINLNPVKYKEENIILGVHRRSNNGSGHNYAIMGNIPYPIDMPNAQTNLEHLSNIDHAELDIHFNIGEIEFQANREGLSYTEGTIAAIRKKYEQIAQNLSTKLAEDLSKIENKWERAFYLVEKSQHKMWNAATTEFLKNSPNELVTPHYGRLQRAYLKIDPAAVESDMNISIKSFRIDSSYNGANMVARDFPARHDNTYSLEISKKIFFVKNTDNGKVWERCRHHFKSQAIAGYVFMLYPTDPTKPMKYDDFFKYVSSPPENQILKVTDLAEKERKKRESIYDHKISLMKPKYMLEAGKNPWDPCEHVLKDLDPNKTYYYFEMKGYKTLTKFGNEIDPTRFLSVIRKSADTRFTSIDIFGVRQSDIKIVKQLPNWMPIEDYIAKTLSNVTEDDFYKYAINKIDKSRVRLYTSKNILRKLPATSPFVTFSEKFSQTAHYAIFEIFSVVPELVNGVDIAKIEKLVTDDFDKLQKRYPMLKFHNNYYGDLPEVIADYINTIDQHKGVN
jgi:hypothetical protein